MNATLGHQRPRVLVLGTAEWNQPIATNQHYMVRELAEAAQVEFVESMGLRRLELRMRDLRRIADRLGRVLSRRRDVLKPRSQRPVPEGTRVLSPVLIPVHTGGWGRLNRVLIRRLVRDWLDHRGPKVLWCYTPVTYGLETFADLTVYHCVDLLGDVPGISKKLIDHHERRLASLDAVAAASSDVVAGHLRSQGFTNPLSWPNVADVRTIESVETGIGREPKTAVFAGNLSTTKVDFALLEALQETGWKVHLAGPISEGGGDASEAVARLVSKGATHHGLLSLEDVARLYWRCEVGLIPYVVNDYTLGVNPLKTFEYLAAGLTVVSTPVPAVSPREGDVVVTGDADSFVRAVTSAQSDSDAVQRRIRIAHEHSWIARGVEARELLNNVG